MTGLAGPAFEQTKTVTFNVEGHRKANAPSTRCSGRCRMSTGSRSTAPSASARDQRIDIAAAGSLTAGNWKQLATQIAVLAAVLGVVVILYKVLM